MAATGGYVKGDRALVGLSHGMVLAKLVCFIWLSLYPKLVQKGFPRFS